MSLTTPRNTICGWLSAPWTGFIIPCESNRSKFLKRQIFRPDYLFFIVYNQFWNSIIKIKNIIVGQQLLFNKPFLRLMEVWGVVNGISLS